MTRKEIKDKIEYWENELAELDKQKTYLIGDKFLWHRDTYVLASVSSGHKVLLINRDTGRRLGVGVNSEPLLVNSIDSITEYEFNKFGFGGTRIS